MIRLSAFFVTRNFARLDHEFYDDKLIVKVKSLTIESENEVEYKKIKVISTTRQANLEWLWFGASIMIWLSLANFIFGYPFRSEAGLFWIERAIILLGLVLCIPSFYRNEFCSFLDGNRNSLTTLPHYEKGIRK